MVRVVRVVRDGGREGGEGREGCRGMEGGRGWREGWREKTIRWEHVVLGWQSKPLPFLCFLFPTLDCFSVRLKAVLAAALTDAEG